MSSSFLGHSQESATLSLKFSGLTQAKGQVMIRITNSANKTVAEKTVAVTDLNPTFSLTLSPGQYAVAAFHDANGNNKLDKNLVGLPTEKYGFSNNVRGSFGPPALADQLVEVNASTEISITLK
jgi:uncharacterized protein (DUF2141 family)